MPDSRSEERVTVEKPIAPVEFLNQDSEAPIAFRCDRTTRNQAKRLIADQWDVPYARVRIRKVYIRWDQSIVDERVKDGEEEPYDGWPAFVECGAENGTAYWTSGNWDEPDLYPEPVSEPKGVDQDGAER